ncbi:sugar ABC transporter ATP-binding protein [Kaistia defluvii]|uniref:sugar ABC transporter ATP-binding protein n=1 Tax=Kaistia defluvii TaxID=410841 RepID=UPI0022589A18|nr:sugar ABC transporter ATP-binding protein [Kaistia defluvii]MCX5520976.1 sugar ABC transporter ATP-binding protein [Kaistia defluvii]
MTSDSFLALGGLVKHFGATKALDRADLALRAGSVHALVGENGAGKSTLIKTLSGLYQPDAGAIRLDGTEVTIDGPRAAEALGFRFIHQELNLVPHFDAVGNAWIGRRHPRRGPFIDRRAMRAKVADVAARIAPDLPLDKPAARLTPGQRQMAEIVRALVDPARLVVMDEPTSSLSEGEAERLHAIVRQLSAEGCAVLFISHRLDEVLDLCDSYTVLRNGRTVGAGRVADTSRAGLVAMMSGTAGVSPSALRPPQPQHPEEAFAESRLEGRTVDVQQKLPGTDALRPSRRPSGPPQDVAVGALPGQSKGRAEKPVLATDLAFGPGDSRFAFSARPGEIVGLYGLVGSGRSSLLKTIWGATPGRGLIAINGQVPGHGPAGRIAAGCAYVPEDRRREGLANALSIESNLSLAHLPDFRAFSPLPMPSRSKIRNFARATGARLRLVAGGLDHSPATLSGGNQQKLLFGRWLGRPIRVLLVDEPTRGVDVGAKAEIHGEMRKIAADGAAILMATSDIEELLALSTRVLVLHAGRLVAELDGPSLTRAAVVAAAFGHAPDEQMPPSERSA